MNFLCRMMRELRAKKCGAISRMGKLMFLGLVFASCSTPALSGSVVYTYDALGRLRMAVYTLEVVHVYSYDAAGNRISYLTGIP